MIKYFEGTVFNTGCDAIVNTINCVGVMGAGIALEFSLRYPDMYKDYVEKCKKNEVHVGEVYIYRTREQTIINFPTKWHFKYPSQLEWIEQGLKDFLKKHKTYGIKSIAFPKLGTLNGGLDWLTVKKIMEKHLSNLDIEVVICLDTLNEAQGLEKRMLDYFNGHYKEVLEEIPKMKNVQVQNIQDNIPFKRFWQIAKTPKIGATTYSKIYNKCKDSVENGDISQTTLFELL